MNIFDFAMQMEKDGQAYYEEMASKAENAVLKNILVNLAQDEVKHYNIFKKFKEGDFSGADQLAVETTVMTDAVNIFQQMASAPVPIGFPEDIVEAWKKAQEVEKKSEDFYREKATEADSDQMKAIINRIADEEHKHWALIENVLQFLSRPKQWLDDAEWNHLEEY